MNRAIPLPACRRGFTLIELMITVAIIGVLAAIAYPSYRSYVASSNRGDAQQLLMQGAQQAERYFAQRNAYTGLTASVAFSGESSVKGFGVYTFAVAAVDATSFRLTATPVAGKANAEDGLLEIDHTGRKGWDRNNDGTISSAERSWNR